MKEENSLNIVLATVLICGMLLIVGFGVWTVTVELHKMNAKLDRIEDKLGPRHVSALTYITNSSGMRFEVDGGYILEGPR